MGEKNLRNIVSRKLNSKKETSRKLDLSGSDVLGELGFGIVIPLVISIAIGWYFTARTVHNFMMPAVLIGLIIGLVNGTIIIYKESKLIDERRKARITAEREGEEK